MGRLDFFLIAGNYTLLNHTALASLLPLCERKGMSVTVGAPFASGLLVRGPNEQGSTYMYQQAEDEINERAGQLQSICAKHSVPLGAAALQFCLANPLVCSVIPGAQSAEEAAQNRELVDTAVPAAVWREMREAGLIRADAPTPDASASL